MPSSSLTASLRSSLVLSRSQLDEWIELEKEKMDVSAEQYRQSLTATQAQVDTAVTHLLALQLEGTLSMESSNVVTSTKEDMKEEQEMLKEEIANLKMEIIDKKCQIKGNVVMCTSHPLTSCMVWAYFAVSYDCLGHTELGLNVLHARDKLVEARDWHENVLQSRGAAVADLGRSVEKYKQLGLEFDKDESEKMIRYVVA